MLAGESEVVKQAAPDALSAVPYAEPTWLAEGFRSPLYTDGHRRFQRAVRKFVSDVIAPEMEQRELDGKKLSQGVIGKMS